MCTKAFWQDVVVTVVFGEDRHTVARLLLQMTVCVVDVVHGVGDVVRVGQTVAVRDHEGEHHRTEFIGAWRNREVLTVL